MVSEVMPQLPAWMTGANRASGGQNYNHKYRDMLLKASLAACASPCVCSSCCISLPAELLLVPVELSQYHSIDFTAPHKHCVLHAILLAQMIEEGKLQPWKVVSHKLPLSQAAEGYAKFDAKEFNKVAMLMTAVSLGCWQLLVSVTC
jgi:hypothetical protein